ncbi:MAG: radical SAM protein [Desulfobacterales bacterium]|nr:radical SAM protein [Desulfobacterales bacterium]
MKILLLYANRFYFVKQVYPFGLDLIANHLGRFGYDATIEYPFLPRADLEKNIDEILAREAPDVIGIGIRNLDTAMACESLGDHEGPGFRTFYFLPEIRRMVEMIKRKLPDALIIAGGGAFTISPGAMLKELGVAFGIVGRGEEPLRLFLEAWPDEERMSRVPGLVRAVDGEYIIHPGRTPDFFNGGAMERDPKFNHAFETAGIPIQVKRGCNRNCSFCVEPAIEGRTFIFRDPDDVVQELKSIAETHGNARRIFFTDTEFNIPDPAYGKALVKKIIHHGLQDHFRFSSQFIPAPFDDPFARLLAEANFSIILTCDSFSDDVLKKNHSPYREADIVKARALLEKYKLNHTVNLIFGLPGETWETVDYTIQVMKRHPPDFSRLYEYTVGGRIYAGTPLCEYAEKEENSPRLYGEKSEGRLKPYYYCSPAPPLKLKEYIENALDWPLTHQDKMTDAARRSLAIPFLADRGRWREAMAMAYESDVSTLSATYDYLFRKLADAGRIQMAAALSELLINAIMESGPAPEYMDQLPLIRHYTSLLRRV